MSGESYTSERRFGRTRLLMVQGNTEVRTFAEMRGQLGEKDLLVMNLSGTVPGSLRLSRKNGEAFELRLAAYAGSSLTSLREWWAVSFGAGSWRVPTEERGEAPRLEQGEVLCAEAGLRLKVIHVDGPHPRLLKVELLGEDFLPALYRAGAPIQYSYLPERLALWHVQTPLAQVPLSVEAPSALFPFRWEELLALKQEGRLAFLYHGAGLSSTGAPALDARLPLPEFSSIPAATVRAWRKTRAQGGRVIAVGTSVARAIESARGIAEGEPRALEGVTTLRVRPGCRLERVDGLLTGYHEPGTSHFDLEAAFCGEERLRRAFELGRAHGFLKHEFGDMALLLPA